MTTSTALVARDLYMRHTAADGKAFVQQHRVEQITEDQYHAERKSK